jgi:cysteine-rich repeat protein
VPTPVCPNGIVEAGEECDDGNTNFGDGCSANCKIERVKCDPPLDTAPLDCTLRDQCSQQFDICLNKTECGTALRCCYIRPNVPNTIFQHLLDPDCCAAAGGLQHDPFTFRDDCCVNGVDNPLIASDCCAFFSGTPGLCPVPLAAGESGTNDHLERLVVPAEITWIQIATFVVVLLIAVWLLVLTFRIYRKKRRAKRAARTTPEEGTPLLPKGRRVDLGGKWA